MPVVLGASYVVMGEDAMSERVTQDDLSHAIMWLEECDAGDAMRASCLKVVDYLRREQQRREDESAIRAIARERGVSPRLIRQAIDAAQTDEVQNVQ